MKNLKVQPNRWLILAGAFLFAALLSTAILVFEPDAGVRQVKFKIGEPAPKTLFSPIEVSYDDAIAIESLRQQRSDEVLRVYRQEPKVRENMVSEAGRFFEILTKLKHSDSRKEKKAPEPFPFQIPDDSLRALQDESTLEEVQKTLPILFEQTVAGGVLSAGEKKELLESQTGFVQILAVDGRADKTVKVEDLLTPEDSLKRAENLLPQPVSRNRKIRKAVLDVYWAVLKPNLLWDEGETKSRRKKAADQVAAPQDTIKGNELIVQRGMLVTPRQRQRIEQIEKRLLKRQVLNQLLAVSLFSCLTYGLSFISLYLFERRFLISYRMTLLFLGVLIGTLSLCKAILWFPAVSPYMIPTALAPLLLGLLARPKLGVLAAVTMGMLAAPLTGFGLEAVLISMASGLAATFSAFRLRKRMQFVQVGAAIGTASFLTIAACRIFQDMPVMESFHAGLLGYANGLLITVPLCFLILPFLETVFNLTTDITLLELSDLNHPLLKRMVVEASGTYHHSLVVSTLAEAACEAIGANALLARVGCYFHDIGKIAQAEYFTENEKKASDRHGPLAPEISRQLILNHVRGGIELGRKYKLREPILRFIPEHHGTSVIYFFYHKAADLAKAGERISPDDYRYPGPKPQTRETAVGMLADSTEAATRSLENPSPEKIRSLARKVINDKFIDGQLDECDLTLRDLHRIQDSFVQNLAAIYHSRVRYPATPEAKDRPDLFEKNEFSKYRSESG